MTLQMPCFVWNPKSSVHNDIKQRESADPHSGEAAAGEWLREWFLHKRSNTNSLKTLIQFDSKLYLKCPALINYIKQAL